MTVAIGYQRARTVARGGHVLSLADLDPAAILDLLEDAAALKASPRRVGAARGPLAGRSVALLFQKPSLRTRVSFEVGVAQLGGTAVVLGGAEIGFGAREPIEDIARTLSRYVDAIVARLLRHEDLEALAAASTVPVVNALSDLEHPCQALADLLTLQRATGLARADDAGLRRRRQQRGPLAGPRRGERRHPRASSRRQRATRPTRRSSTRRWRSPRRPERSIVLGHDPVAAVDGADAVYTDVWTSMGQEAESEQRRRDFAGFTVSTALLAHTDRRGRASTACRPIAARRSTPT